MQNETEFAAQTLSTPVADDLYFIGAKDRWIKVGRSRSVEARARNIQTSSPYQIECLLTLPGMGWTERYWHEGPPLLVGRVI